MVAIEFVHVPATNPLNVVRITSPGSCVPAVIGNVVLYRNASPRLLRERVTLLTDRLAAR